MASNFIPLKEAAERLGIPTDRLVEMRSQGEIRGFRDGASWKFPESEIERVKDELADVLDEAPSGGSSLLVSEEDLGAGGGKSTVIGGDKESEAGSGTGSDLGVGEEKPGSDVDLVARQGDDQDVELVQSGSDAASGSDLQEADDAELRLRAEDEGEFKLADDAVERAKKSGSGSKIESDLSLEADPMEGSDRNLDLLDDDLSVAGDASDARGGDSDKADVLSGIDLTSPEGGGTGDLIRGDSDPAIEGGDVGSGVGGFDDALSDDDLVISDDDDDDLVLGGAGSDISIAGDSGINLMSPSDSGLSLESEPLDLAGSSISALDLGAEVDEGGSSASGSGIGSGSLVDFQADEEFQLSPSGVDIDADDDSGSQVIEVEDSQAFGSDVDLGEGDLEGDVFGEADVVEDDALVGEEAFAADEAMDIDGVGVDPDAAPATAAVRPVYEVPFSLFNVITLACVLLVMCIGGMLATDLMRNMVTYSETSAPVSSLTETLVDMAGLNP